MKITAKIDEKCTGRKQHYIIGDKNSPISGGLYLERGKEPPQNITIIFNIEKKEKGKPEHEKKQL